MRSMSPDTSVKVESGAVLSMFNVLLENGWIRGDLKVIFGENYKGRKKLCTGTTIGIELIKVNKWIDFIIKLIEFNIVDTKVSKCLYLK